MKIRHIHRWRQRDVIHRAWSSARAIAGRHPIRHQGKQMTAEKMEPVGIITSPKIEPYSARPEVPLERRSSSLLSYGALVEWTPPKKFGKEHKAIQALIIAVREAPGGACMIAYQKEAGAGVVFAQVAKAHMRYIETTPGTCASAREFRREWIASVGKLPQGYRPMVGVDYLAGVATGRIGSAAPARGNIPKV